MLYLSSLYSLSDILVAANRVIFQRDCLVFSFSCLYDSEADLMGFWSAHNLYNSKIGILHNYCSVIDI